MTHEEAYEWYRAAESKSYFINKFCKIKDPLGGIVPFALHDFQETTLVQLTSTRKSLILKARQMGLTWLVAADVLHDCLFRKACLQIVISKTEDDAYDIMERIQFMYDLLPKFFHEMEVTERNKGAISLSNYSKIKSQPTTQNAGRGKPPYKLVIDEFAFCRFDTLLFNSAETALSHGGKAVVLSTANGYGNEFARLWFGAMRGENNYVPIFLPWYAYPGRTLEWIESETKGWQEWRRAQEYPDTWESAFRQTGRPAFESDYLVLTASAITPLEVTGEDLFEIARTERETRLPYPAEDSALARLRDRLRIYQLPAGDHGYVIGADIAEGLLHGDNSSVTVLDPDSGEEVAAWYGKCPLDDFARLLDELSFLYPGVLLPERNNHGHAVIMLLEGLHNPYLHWSKPLYDMRSGKRIRDRKAGWETTNVNKSLMIDDLAMALKLGSYRPASAHFIDEATKYETAADGTYNAPSGHTDDAVMSTAIAWAGRKFAVKFEAMSSGQSRTSLTEKWDV